MTKYTYCFAHLKRFPFITFIGYMASAKSIEKQLENVS